MEAKKQLNKPENWDDFESLCKKLWGEIWDCKEIKKNGKKGQTQNGVDICGVPKGENSYYGIQCKGKDAYSQKKLSQNEIDKEINLAKSFSPPLAKLYIATTANKDAKIEEYIRLKDLENRQAGHFEVHLFAWEDIVDLIDENKQTYDWYLNLQKFKQNSDILVSFENDKSEMTGSVLFCEQLTHFSLGQKRSIMFDYTSYKLPVNLDSPSLKGENKSYFRFRIKIKNIGNAPIENPKIIIHGNGNHKEIGDEYIALPSIPINTKTDIEINESQGNLFINLRRSVLVPEEEYISNLICIKPDYEGADLELAWKLVSNSFNKEGVLNLKIQTSFIQKEVFEYVDFKQHIRRETSIVDCFEGDLE